MITLEFPEIMPWLKDSGPGLYPFKISSGGYVLALKASGDFAQAVRAIKEIKFHFYGLQIGEKSATGLLTAIYDREEEPFVIRTICSSSFTQDLVKCLHQEQIKIGFFDAHNGEIYSGTWMLEFSQTPPEFVFKAPSFGAEHNAPIEFHVEMEQRYKLGDDGYLIRALEREKTSPDNVVVLQMTEDHLLSKKREALGLFHSQLDTSNNPGETQEAEIARVASAVFGRENVYINPETDKRPEFSDVLVVSGQVLISIQAKALKRDANSATAPVDKIYKKLSKHFEKAASQSVGADRAFRELGETITFKGKPIGIDASQAEIINMIIMPEKPKRLLGEWSDILRRKNKNGSFIAVLDYAEFMNMAVVYREMDDFLAATMSILEAYEQTQKIGQYLFSGEKSAIYE